MDFEFQSLLQFKDNLNEVNELVIYAAKNEGNELRYKTFNKAAILLLTSKLELFLEDVLYEYVDSLNKLELSVLTIPDSIKLPHSLGYLESLDNMVPHFHKKTAICEMLREVSPLWCSADVIFKDLSIEFKFNFGRHGEREIIKLFRLIGVENIFSEIHIYQHKGGKKVKIDIRGKLNSLIAIRNNIVHQDATPTLTHVQVREFVSLIKSFANEILKYLKKNRDNLVHV